MSLISHGLTLSNSIAKCFVVDHHPNPYNHPGCIKHIFNYTDLDLILDEKDSDE